MKKLLYPLPFFCLILTACSPKIQLETPPEGITINMNVVVDHKIEVQMDKKSRAVIKTIDQKAP
ncbi:hypothetical protein A4G19_01780 [Pasteurellaceae bacterium Macca]|nr:hypothetical protein [Pasteurellaceae bacterium Macca]